MSLQNHQYDIIMSEYDEKQQRRRRLLDDRLTLIRKKLPQYGELEDQVAALCMGELDSLISDSTRVPDLHSSLLTLKKKKQELLSRNGFSEDYLDPPYDCPDCKDTGYIGDVKCHCFKQRITRLLYDQSNLGAHLAAENFDTLSYKYYQGDDLKAYKKAVLSAHNFVDEFPTGRNLLLYGNVGSGKTFLSKCIAKALIDKGHTVIYYSASLLADILSTRYPDPSDLAPGEIAACDLLIVDDLGTEHPSDYIISRIFSCLDLRLRDKKSTIISTNLTLSAIRDIYSERTFSRIAYGYEIFNINCPDIRVQKRKHS